LACANIKHFGRSRMNAELILVLSARGAPEWLIAKDEVRSRLTQSDLRRHISILAES